jgi:hypothetical protein
MIHAKHIKRPTSRKELKLRKRKPYEKLNPRNTLSQKGVTE